MSAMRFSPAAARVFLSAADTWYPMHADPEVPGAAALDLIAELDGCLLPGEIRRLEVLLWGLEWLPRLALRRAGFCWLPLDQRRNFLLHLEQSPLGPLRRRVERLREIVDASHSAALDQASSIPA